MTDYNQSPIGLLSRHLTKLNNPKQAASLDPSDFGFVCSIDDWRFVWKREKIIIVFANPRRKAAA